MTSHFGLILPVPPRQKRRHMCITPQQTSSKFVERSAPPALSYNAFVDNEKLCVQKKFKEYVNRSKTWGKSDGETQLF